MMPRGFARTLFTLIAGVLLLPLAALAGQYNAVLDIGDPMPTFENLPGIDGSTLSSDDLDADVVILVFLANHCPWVIGLDTDMVSLVGGLEGENVQFVGVSVNHREDDRLPAMKVHAEKAGYNLPYVFDESQDLGRELGATRTPEYFVFDKERKLVYMGLIHDSPAMRRRDGSIHYTNGEPTTFYVADAIRATLAGEAVAVAETQAVGCNVEYEG